MVENDVDFSTNEENEETDTTGNASEIRKEMVFISLDEIREAAICTMAFLGHPAWLSANDKKTLNSSAISHWIYYNRAKMAMERVTVAQVVGGVRGVIPCSKLALYADYEYDLELEDMYDILEEAASKQSGVAANNSSIKELRNPLNTSQAERLEKKKKYPVSNESLQKGVKMICETKSEPRPPSVCQWASKWKKLLAHVRRCLNQGKATDFWTDTLLKMCLKFLSALKCNEALVQLMNMEIPFITNYNQLYADPITMIELMSLPQPAMEDNLHVDSTQEDSLWLKLSSPYIRKLWAEDKNIWFSEKKSSRDGSFPASLPDPTIGATNFLRKQLNKNEKRKTSDEEMEIPETKARELLGSLLDAMDENTTEIPSSKPPFPEAHGEWTKTLYPRGGGFPIEFHDKPNECQQHIEHENAIDRIGPQMRHYPMPLVPMPNRHMYPPRQQFPGPPMRPHLPPQNACRPWNIANRLPQPVIPPIPLDNHGVQLFRGPNFQPPCMPFKADQPMVPPMPYNYPPHRVLLLKPGQMPQTHTEQMKAAFHPNMTHKTPVENQSPLPQLEWKKDFTGQDLSVKSGNTMPQFIVPFVDKFQRRPQVVMLEPPKMRKVPMPNVCRNEQGAPHPYFIKPAFVNRHSPACGSRCSPKCVQYQRIPFYDVNAITCQQQNYLHSRTKMHLTRQWVECTDFEAFRTNSECSDLKDDEFGTCGSPTPQNQRKKLQNLYRESRLQKRGLRAFEVHIEKSWYIQARNLKFEVGNVSVTTQETSCDLFSDAMANSALQDEVKYANFFRALQKILLNRLKKSNLKRAKTKYSFNKSSVSNVCIGDHNLLRKYHVLKHIRTSLKPNKNDLPLNKMEKQRNSSMDSEISKNSKDKKRNLQEICNRSRSKEPNNENKKSNDPNRISKGGHSQKFRNKKTYINPSHSHFEQKSWVDNKIENQINAQYFHMIADSLIFDSSFKTMKGYTTDTSSSKEDKIDGWMHFKLAIQEVLRKAANHLMNDSLVNAPPHSKSYYNSFLNTMYSEV